MAEIKGDGLYPNLSHGSIQRQVGFHGNQLWSAIEERGRIWRCLGLHSLICFFRFYWWVRPSINPGFKKTNCFKTYVLWKICVKMLSRGCSSVLYVEVFQNFNRAQFVSQLRFFQSFPKQQREWPDYRPSCPEIWVLLKRQYKIRPSFLDG